MTKYRFLVRFWGVRGSYPTPGAQTLRHGGNTACVEVQVGEHTLILDAGTGLIGLGDKLMQRPQRNPLNLTLLITHGHTDHLNGFPFFTPLFDPNTRIHLFGPELAGQSIRQIVTSLMSPPYFPVGVDHLPSRCTFQTISDEQCIRWHPSSLAPPPYDRQKSDQEANPTEVRVCAKFTRCHPLNGVVIYRIEYAGRSVVFATDVEWSEGCEPDLLAFMEGADLLIHDAQYTEADYQHGKRGYGHSTIEIATDVARAAHVRELMLFHHDPTYDDDQLDRMETQAQARFARTRSAYEGMEIDLLA